DIPAGKDFLFCIKFKSDNPWQFERIPLVIPVHDQILASNMAAVDFTSQFQHKGMAAGVRVGGSLKPSSEHSEVNQFYVPPDSDVISISLTIVDAKKSVGPGTTTKPPPLTLSPAETKFLEEKILPGTQKYFDAQKRLEGKF